MKKYIKPSTKSINLGTQPILQLQAVSASVQKYGDAEVAGPAIEISTEEGRGWDDAN